MFQKFNSKIFGVALIPFYLYAIISIFVFVSSGYDLDIFQPLSVIVISLGTIASAVCVSFPNKKLHILGTLIMLMVGGIGIYLGLTIKPINFIELFLAACIIAFAFAMYELVSKRLNK